MSDIEKEPKQINHPEEYDVDSVAELAPDKPERLSLIEKLKGPMGRTALRAVEMISDAAGEVIARAPEFRDSVESLAIDVADRTSEASKKVAEIYEKASDGAQDLARKAGETAGPIIESAKDTVIETAKDTYVEVVKPIGGDVLTALGKEYGVESREGKIKVRPIKLGRAVLGAITKPGVEGTKAVGIIKKTIVNSSAKMFVG